MSMSAVLSVVASERMALANPVTFHLRIIGVSVAGVVLGPKPLSPVILSLPGVLPSVDPVVPLSPVTLDFLIIVVSTGRGPGSSGDDLPLF